MQQGQRRPVLVAGVGGGEAAAQRRHQGQEAEHGGGQWQCGGVGMV